MCAAQSMAGAFQGPASGPHASVTYGLSPQPGAVTIVPRAGVWEISEVDAVLTALERSYATSAPRRPVLVDIGANLGVFSLVAAALGYDVIAFEAMARNVDAIWQTLCWNPELRERVTLFPYALGNADRSCAVLADIGNVGDGHLACSEHTVRSYRHMARRGAAHSVRLGDYLEGVAADVVKLDVEGYEPHVLAGAGAASDPLHISPRLVLCGRACMRGTAGCRRWNSGASGSTTRRWLW